MTARLVELGLRYADEQSGSVDKADPLILNATGRGTRRKTSFLTDALFMRDVRTERDRMKDSITRLLDPVEGMTTEARQSVLMMLVQASATLNQVYEGMCEMAGIVDAKTLKDEVVNGE